MIVTTVAFAGLGPPLGSAVAVIFGMFLSLPHGRGVGDMILGLVPILIVIQPIAFMLGEIPALVTGLVVALIAHRVPRLFLGSLWKRGLLGGVVGMPRARGHAHAFAKGHALCGAPVSASLVRQPLGTALRSARGCGDRGHPDR